MIAVIAIAAGMGGELQVAVPGVGFVVDGIASLSIKSLRMITLFGAIASILESLMLAWLLVSYFEGVVVPGWSSSVICVCLLGGIQLLFLGVSGECVGKIYLESKRRPRYVVSAEV